MEKVEVSSHFAVEVLQYMKGFLVNCANSDSCKCSNNKSVLVCFILKVNMYENL